MGRAPSRSGLTSRSAAENSFFCLCSYQEGTCRYLSLPSRPSPVRGGRCICITVCRRDPHGPRPRQMPPCTVSGEGVKAGYPPRRHMFCTRRPGYPPGAGGPRCLLCGATAGSGVPEPQAQGVNVKDGRMIQGARCTYGAVTCLCRETPHITPEDISAPLVFTGEILPFL